MYQSMKHFTRFTHCPICNDCILLSLSQASREQLAIAEFANSLLVIPKTLSVNAAKDSVDLVAKLRAYHNASQVNADKAHLKW